ncbi:sugar/pyridoxal phosphate phosphatase YigL [Vibrio sp. UCD-FRSSP16_10]|uniref:Cof-type HAD-IIB family hydrolase n=1 Tax=unclassified Vibrio TaxID=2614977 RepID=UPI0007FD1636|nr:MULTISPECIES: Cof-type HAD-IIB family hydrolase [unclassified Vibrio]OBT10223.1 sugar/pyridoxal phosphate phosphatase YigL [Vibrio sp. UCD-FRSSP16_30]OBT19013.1 sugar/pyridoxal phosphate phosphatase YigL [Vibrio sp. UCD-FRSSP16_10]
MTVENTNFENISIVASDLDGTLLAPDHQLSDFTKQTLKQLHEQGYTFIFATGRHHIDVAYIRQDVDIPAYMITSNGARVHDINNNLMYSQNVNPDRVQAVIDIIRQDPEIIIHIYQDDKWWVNQTDEQLLAFSKHSGFAFALFDDTNAPKEGIAKVFFTHESHEYLATFEDKLNQVFGDELNIAFSTPWCLEVMQGNVSKGNALQAVAKTLNKDLSNCIAFGDGMNDAEMLLMAGMGKVMQTSHQKVKDALPNNEIIGSNEDDAVAHYLVEHLLR